MKIGIDIDGVINNLQMFHLKCGTQFSQTHHLNCETNPRAYELRDMFGWDESNYRKFQREYYKMFFLTSAYVRPFAKETIQHLGKHHEIYIITARSPSLPLRLGLNDNISVYDISAEWLKNVGISYRQLICTAHSKWDILAQYGIDIMIEDSPIFLGHAASHQHTKAICFDAPYNRAFPGAATISRIYDWHQTLDLISTTEGCALQ